MKQNTIAVARLQSTRRLT